MKNLKFLFVLLVSISILSTGCDKNDDPADPGTNYKGSYDVNINGVTYNKLKSDVIEVEEGVTFFADNNNGGQFQIVIADVPAVGETVELSLDFIEGETAVLVSDGPIDSYTILIGGAGTVYRQADKKYELDITLYGGLGFGTEFPMSGNITVGTVGTASN